MGEVIYIFLGGLTEYLLVECFTNLGGLRCGVCHSATHHLVIEVDGELNRAIRSGGLLNAGLVAGTRPIDSTILRFDAGGVVVELVLCRVHSVGVVHIPPGVGGEGAAAGHTHAGEVQQLVHGTPLIAELLWVEAEELEHGVYHPRPHASLSGEREPLEDRLELGGGECVGDELRVGLQAVHDGWADCPSLPREVSCELAELSDAAGGSDLCGGGRVG